MKEMYTIINSMFDSGSSLIEALEIDLEDAIRYVLEEHPEKFFLFYKNLYEEYTGNVYNENEKEIDFNEATLFEEVD